MKYLSIPSTTLKITYTLTYVDYAITPSLEQLDGRELLWVLGASPAYSVGAPMMIVLSNAERLIPLFAMPQVRIVS